MALKPQTVFDEQLARQRVAGAMPGRAEEPVEPVVLAWIGQARRPPVRAEEHAARHVIAPEPQRPAVDADAQASPEQMRGRGQAVGTRAGDYNVVLHDDVLDVFVTRDSREVITPPSAVR